MSTPAAFCRHTPPSIREDRVNAETYVPDRDVLCLCLKSRHQRHKRGGHGLWTTEWRI
jgi:hypothetical protein